jgi:microcystin-dependent protein
MNDTSPDFLFGGEWERIKDTFLLACSGTYPAGSTGGEAEHTLSLEEMPSHKGHLYDNGETGNWDDAGVPTYYIPQHALAQHSTDRPFIVQNRNELVMRGYTRGGNQPHNNMPPYLAVHMWQRIA